MVTILSFLLFTGFVAGLTIILTRKDDHVSSDGYFLAGRRLGAGFIAGSLLLTNLSTEQMVGLNGGAFKDGLCVMVWEVVAVVALVMMAIFFLPRFLKSGITTVPQFLEERFDQGAASITNIIFLTAYAAILLPIILYSGAMGLSDIINVKGLLGITGDTVNILGMVVTADTFVLWLTVWVVGLAGSCYAIFGGLRTVAVSDTINAVGLLIGGLMITFFGLDAISRTVGDGSGIFNGLSVISETQPEKLNSIGSAKTSVPFSTIFTGILLLNLFYWCTNQQIIQRTFGAKNLAEGQKGVLLTALLKLIGPLYLVLPGIMAYVLYSSDVGFKGDRAYGTLVSDVLPPYLRGFFAAVLVGAILSSFNSALNSTSTIFSLGVYKKFINKKADERAMVRSGKSVGWTIAIAAMLIAPWLAKTESIFSYLQTMNGIYFIPIFAVVLVGMLSKRIPAKAAKLGLIVGLVVLLGGYFIPIGEKSISDNIVVPIAEKEKKITDGYALVKTVTIQPTLVKTSFSADDAKIPTPITYVEMIKAKKGSKFFAGNPENGDVMHTFHFLGVVFAGLVVMMLIIGAVSPSAEPWVHHHSGDVDITPWKHAKLAGVILIILVLIIYACFADFSVLSATTTGVPTP